MKETSILLTGAGFTHNFGTPLAKEMWAEIFNNVGIQSNKLRSIMLDPNFDFDYEAIYYHILNTDSSLAFEKEVMLKATTKAYENLDNIVMDYKSAQDSKYQIGFFRVKEFIKEFKRHGAHQLFTLNQDLFLERKFHNERNNDEIYLSIPGINQSFLFCNTYDFKSSPITLPNEVQLEEYKKNYLLNDGYQYIKLHGSQNWSSSTGDRRMVIGRNKEEQIKKEPLLNWYFKIFREVISQPNMKLLVIGYSFSDEHINKVISEAILQHNLKVYILMPKSPDVIISELNKRKFGEIIKNSIFGFFSYNLSQVFPQDNSESHFYKEIKEHLF